MRATQTTTYRSLQSFLDRTSDRMQALQLQAATGKRINRPSDDPTAISPVLSARTQIMSSNRYIETIDSGMDRINNMDGYLDSIQNTLVRLKEIGVATINSSLSPQDMQTYADEVHQLRETLLSDGNAQVDGKYMFAGFSEKTSPFILNTSYDPTLYNPADPATYPVTYQGDNGNLQFEIAPNERISLNITGSSLFLGDNDNDGVTDPGAVNIFALLTTMEDVLRANNQATGWTVPGVSATQTTAYSLGPPVQGEIQQLDLSGSTLTDGQSLILNIDGTDFTYTNNTGAYLTGVDLAAAVATDLAVTNYTLTDAGGGILSIAQNPGSEAAIALTTTTVETPATTLQSLLEPIETAANQVRAQRSLKGNIGKRLETARDHMEQIKIDMEAFRSRFEDADILETITSLQQQQQSFEAALNVTGKVSQLSILDYI
jgi:flagellar hook-associated protein 3 FlgL